MVPKQILSETLTINKLSESSEKKILNYFNSLEIINDENIDSYLELIKKILDSETPENQKDVNDLEWSTTSDKYKKKYSFSQKNV